MRLIDAAIAVDKQPTVEVVPLKALAAWLAGYAAPPRDAMRAAIPPGGGITQETLTAAWEMTLRQIAKGEE